ncbi:MAG: YggS family pyridoxal phosphate-dependent enzyme, partial [Prolixibacteraceae bacterium]
KFGLNRNEAKELLESEVFSEMEHVKIAGVMGMATFTDNQEKIRKEFRMLKEIFEWLKVNYFPGSVDFTEISMGMSDDYTIAIGEGSTIIRVGSKIFGERNY